MKLKKSTEAKIIQLQPDRLPCPLKEIFESLKRIDTDIEMCLQSMGYEVVGKAWNGDKALDLLPV